MFRNPGGILHSGASGNIVIPETLDNALIIPCSATFELQDQVFAYKIIDRKAVATRLVTSLTDDGKRYVVKSGLEPGDTILAEGVGMVRDGQEIRTKEAWLMMQDYEQAAVTGLIAAVASQYYTLLMLDRQIELTESTAVKFQRSVEVLEAMKDAGMANETAIAQMRGAYWQVKAGTESIAQAIKEIENSLCATLGETPHGIERGNIDTVEFTAELKTGVPAALLERRPDVRAAEHNLAGAYYAVNVARGSMLPSLSLSGAAGWTNSAGAVVNPGGLILSAAGSLFQPIFNARDNAAKVKIAKSQQEEAMLNFRQTVLDAGAEVNNALTLYQSASRRIEARIEQTKALEEAVEKTEYLMRYSSTTYLEVLTAEQSLLSAQTDLVQDRYDLIYSVISLYHALGGR